MLGRRSLLALAGAVVVTAEAEACTLVPYRRPTLRDVHSDAKAHAALRRFVAVLNGAAVTDDDNPPDVHFDSTDGATERRYPEDYLTSADKRDGAPATLGNVTQLATSRYDAAYLAQLVRNRVFFPAQDGGSCGPYEDSYAIVSETWLFRFARNRLTDARRLPEFDDDFRTLFSQP